MKTERIGNSGVTEQRKDFRKGTGSGQHCREIKKEEGWKVFGGFNIRALRLFTPPGPGIPL